MKDMARERICVWSSPRNSEIKSNIKCHHYQQVNRIGGAFSFLAIQKSLAIPDASDRTFGKS